jgi:hypothetical protein
MVRRALVFFLVFANALYFLWTQGIGAMHSAPRGSTTPSLRLLSESSLPVNAGASAGAASVDGPGPGANATKAADPSAGAGGSVSAPAGASPGPAAASAVDAAGRCITVGPFPDVAEAAHAAATLRGGGYEPRQRVTEGEVWAGVWVYLPQPPTAAAEDELKGKLKSAGVEDALDMPGPNDKPVISLGLFSDPRRAQARVAQMQGLGLNPGIADRKRTGEVHWVDVDLKPNDHALNPADLQGEAGRIVRLEVKTCPVTENPPP